MADRIGRQTPTRSFVLPYKKTSGEEAIQLYERSGRKAMDWQKLLVYDMLARNKTSEWTHMSFGYAVPRQNGKNEIVVIREMYGLLHGERILHTAHRTGTAHAAWERLVTVLTDAKLIDPGLKDKGLYRANGKEHIYLDAYVEGGGRIEFRTRTSKGGLGESYDLLVIDEAQEYQDDQKAALQYTISASENPQTVLCGTPPTVSSVGTIFPKMRQSTLAGEAEETAWEEWSVDQMSDPHDRDLWYLTNPALGIRLKERTIRNEIGTDDVDFNVQRLGLWLTYAQESAISQKEWEDCKVEILPKLRGKLFIGIKYSQMQNVAMSIAVKTTDQKIFVEAIDCRPIRATNRWIMDFFRAASWKEVVIDGQNGQRILADLMKSNPDVLFDSAILSALIGSCCFIYISENGDDVPHMQVIDGANATGIIDPTTGLLEEGYAVLSRDPDTENVVRDAYFLPGETTIFDYEEQTQQQFTSNAPAPLLVPIIYRPDARRPFGHSRISRACMNIQNQARMTLTRANVSAEFYSMPQRYVLGLSDDAEFESRKATYSSFLAFYQDAEGNSPTLGQFSQQSMQPHIDQFKMCASAFAGETGLTMDDLGFVTENPTSAEAIKASHETLRLTARKAQRTFGSGFLNAGYLAACLRDDYAFSRTAISQTIPHWAPIFEPDAAQMSGIGDAAIKINQAVPGYFDKDSLERLTGIKGGEAAETTTTTNTAEGETVNV